MIRFEPIELEEREERVYEPLKGEEIKHLIKQDLNEPGLEEQQPQNSLLKIAQENVVKLTQTADEYTSVLASLKQVEISAKNHMEYTEKKIIEMVKGELRSFKNVLKDLLKSHRGKSGAQVLEEKTRVRSFTFHYRAQNSPSLFIY